MKKTCEYCNGQGGFVEYESGHGCDGTDENCARVCPVPIQVQEPCPVCYGEGYVDIYLNSVE